MLTSGTYIIMSSSLTKTQSVYGPQSCIISKYVVCVRVSMKCNESRSRNEYNLNDGEEEGTCNVEIGEEDDNS